MTPETIDLLADAGFLPADEATGRIAEWIADRFDAWRPLADDRHAVVYLDDGILALEVLTPSGVTETRARFDAGDLGGRLFAAACTALDAR